MSAHSKHSPLLWWSFKTGSSCDQISIITPPSQVRVSNKSFKALQYDSSVTKTLLCQCRWQTNLSARKRWHWDQNHFLATTRSTILHLTVHLCLKGQCVCAAPAGGGVGGITLNLSVQSLVIVIIHSPKPLSHWFWHGMFLQVSPL